MRFSGDVVPRTRKSRYRPFLEFIRIACLLFHRLPTTKNSVTFQYWVDMRLLL